MRNRKGTATTERRGKRTGAFEMRHQYNKRRWELRLRLSRANQRKGNNEYLGNDIHFKIFG